MLWTDCLGVFTKIAKCNYSLVLFIHPSTYNNPVPTGWTFMALIMPWDNGEKYCRARQTTDDNMTHVHCMLDTKGYKYTHRICNTYCFSTATVVVRTHINVKLYIHFLLCLLHYMSLLCFRWKLTFCSIGINYSFCFIVKTMNIFVHFYNSMKRVGNGFCVSSVLPEKF
jgi:hypothetical protein